MRVWANPNLNPNPNPIQVAPPCDELSQKPPIFSLEVVITAEHTFAYSSDLSKFEPTLCAVFDAAIDNVQAIPQVYTYICMRRLAQRHTACGSACLRCPCDGPRGAISCTALVRGMATAAAEVERC